MEKDEGVLEEGNVNERIFDNEDNLEDFIDYEQGGNCVVTETISNDKKQKSVKERYFLEIMKMWEKEKKMERFLKYIFSGVIGVLLIVQIIILNVLLFNIGAKKFQFDEWTLRLFITGVFAEIVALIKIIITNLFPKNGGKEFMEFLSNTFEETGSN